MLPVTEVPEPMVFITPVSTSFFLVIIVFIVLPNILKKGHKDKKP
jgi:hypothetical protein